MSQSLNHCVAVLRHPSQSESYNICSQRKAAGAWCVAHLTANACASPSRWQSECICSRWCCGAVLSWKLWLNYFNTVFEKYWIHTLTLSWFFNGFPFSTRYKGLYCSANTPVGTCCCVIRGWGGAAGNTAGTNAGICDSTIQQAIKTRSFWSQKVQSTWTSLSLLAGAW